MKSEYERNRKYLEDAKFLSNFNQLNKDHLTKEQKEAIVGVLIS